MRTLSRLLKASLIPALLACALALPSAPSSSAQTDNRGLDIVKIRAEDGQEIKLYDKSYALVIGVSDYAAGWPKLPGVRQDVEAVARALERQGFQVTTVLNPDSAELDKSFKTFIDQYGLGVENRLLFYFAGHGHTIKQSYGDEMGYIVPVDAPNPLRDQPGFMSKAMDMQQMELYARRIQSKHALFVFDSCFSGSIFALSRAIPESIGYKTAQPVRQFITSGSADEQVPDKSIFREQFIEAIGGEADTNHDGYVTGTELGEFLQDKVVNYSRNTQHPQYGKIRNPRLDKGDFVFALPKAAKPPAVAANTNPAPTQPAPVDPAAVELMFWDSIKSSTDAEDFKDYLSKYPNGQFAGIARRRAAALSNLATPTTTPAGGSTSPNTTSATSSAGRPPDTTPSSAGAKRPIALGNLVLAIKINGLTTAELVHQIQARGVAFEMTADAESQLRDAGARPEIIEAARSNYRPETVTPASNSGSRDKPNVPPGPPLSKDEIVTMLRGGIASARVEQFVNARGVNFLSNEAIVQEIKRAGGADSLVGAITAGYVATDTHNSPGYDNLIDQAAAAYDAKDAARATQLLQQAIQLEPNSPRAYQLLGFTQLYLQNNITEAEKNMRRAIDLGGSAVFRVFHDHDGSFGQYCQGVLFVTKTGMSFKADDGRDTFEAENTYIKEAKVNSVMGAQVGAFHIKLAQPINGKSIFNFAPLTRGKAESDLIIRLIKVNE